MQYLTGRRSLEQLACAGEYLFHGSPDAGITVFTPRPAQSRGSQQGKAIEQANDVVYATEHLDVAIFAAVVFHLGRSGWYTHSDSKPISFTFNADADVVKKAQSSIGYVYVFAKNDFEPSQVTDDEFISRTAITPLYRVKVDAGDVRPALDTLQPDPDPSH